MIDFRFEIVPMPEPELGASYLVRVIEQVEAPADDRWPVPTLVDGPEVEAFYTDDPGGAVAGAREAQARRREAGRLGVHPLELEFAAFGPAWQREQEAWS
jgi:hypothetical protein